MRKSFLLFFTVIVAFAMSNIVAQEQSYSTGAVPYMDDDRTPTIVNQLDNPASIAYGYESLGLMTITMPIPAGTPFTNLAAWTAPNFASSMIKGGDGVYYLVDNGPPGALFSFDPGTGAVTMLTALSGNAEGPNGISYNPVNDMYYMIGSTEFYSLDIGTGVATLIGNTGVAGALFIDLCFDAAGVCYAYDLVSDAAYTIDPGTGVATMIGALGFDANYGQGMSYDMETGTIYLSAFNNTTVTGQLLTMDPGTGATTLITDWGFMQVAPFALDTDWIIPVELTSFTANASFGVVELQWITATETNNQGFEVQRSNGSDFETVAFVDGYGSTSETQVYRYTDKSVEVGVYTYRLKQVDFDGTFEYSDDIEVDVPSPAEFGLEQNYPNPFNPSTKISFQLKVDAKVSLKVFDVLGQEVATIVNSNLVAGGHSVDFDASALNSGVYLYRIEATGNDGSNFIDVKKMILTK